MRVFVSGVLLLALAVLFGCNGIQVVDNMYGPCGGQYVNVASDMKYLGNPDVYNPSNCINNCPTFDSSNVRTRADLFAKDEDGKLSELCVIERRKIATGYYWMPMYGNKAMFGDREYLEEYVVASKMSSNEIKAYSYYLENNGYDLDVPDIVGRVLIRNMNKTTKIVYFYGCSTELIPEGIRGDFDKESEFVKKRFEERFVVQDS